MRPTCDVLSFLAHNLGPNFGPPGQIRINREVHESYNQRNTQDPKLRTQKQLSKGGVRNKERGNKDNEVEK